MEKELMKAVLGLMLGGTDAQFVSECMKIYNRHHLRRVADAYGRMDAHKAAQRIQSLLKSSVDEMRTA